MRVGRSYQGGGEENCLFDDDLLDDDLLCAACDYERKFTGCNIFEAKSARGVDFGVVAKSPLDRVAPPASKPSPRTCPRMSNPFSLAVTLRSMTLSPESNNICRA